MPMFPSSSVSPVLLAMLLLLVPAMSASPARPHQLTGLQFLLSSFASPWSYPMNELLQGLPMHSGCPSINPFCLTPGCPKEPGPSALSQSSLCQFPGEGHAWLLLPLLLPRLWPCALRPLGHNPLHSTHRRPSHLQPYSSTHLSPGSPGSPSPSQRWHRADRLWRPLLTPAHLSPFLLLEDLCELSHCLLYIHRLFCLFSAGMGGLNKNTLMTRW